MQFQYQTFHSKRLPNPETLDDFAPARSSLEQIWSRFASGWVEGAMVGLAALTALGLLVFRMPGDCRAPPVAFRPGAVQEVAMSVPRGRACGVAIKTSSAKVIALSIETAPQFGHVQRRGLTGATYRPDAAYKGEDFFAIALEAPGTLGTAAMLVRVKVEVE
jgi:hypothetical protein